MELLFTGEFPPFKGGIGAYVHARCLGSPADGIAVFAADVSGSREWDRDCGLSIRRFPYRFGTSLGRRAMQVRSARVALGRALTERHYRAVTANVLFPFGWIAATTRRRGHRVALFCHGAELLRARQSRLGRWIYRQTLARADLFIANSRMTADTLIAHGCSEDRIRVIPPPVDSRRFRPGLDGTALRRQWLGDRRGPVLLSICRLDDVGKGIDTLLGLLPRLRRRFPEILYVVVGDGPRRAAFEAIAQEQSVADNVRFAGRLPDAMLPTCYAASDAFILLSRQISEIGYYEGFGIVYREAMACQTPVIVSREAGFRDYVIDGVTGRLTDPRNEEEIFRVCCEVLDNPEHAARLARRGLAFAHKPADWSSLDQLGRNFADGRSTSRMEMRHAA